MVVQLGPNKVRWVMTPEAHTALLDQLAQLRRDVSVLAGQGLEEGIVRLPIAQAARRLQVLTSVVDAAAITADSCVAIGRSVQAKDDDGNLMHYAIVFPGDGDPAQGWVSADSPLGSALLGAKPGTTVMVDAPAGRWNVTVLNVD